MIEDILGGLVRLNLAIALPLLAVFALRKPVRKLFGARAAYLLWIAPVLAGVAALVPPASPTAFLTAPTIELVATAARDAVQAGVHAAPGVPGVVFNAWVMGVAAALALLVGRQAFYMRRLGRLERVGPRTWRAAQAGVGPAVVGALRPMIVTPADFETRFAADERSMILAHESAHLARGDARINLAACLALCVCWFNPLVHLAVRLMRQDQELACDATVLGRFPEARKLYAEVLLKTQLCAQALPVGCHWPAASPHPLKERIVMLKSPLPARGRGALGFTAVAVLSLAAACTAWAAQPGKPKPATAPTIGAPDWIERPKAEDVAWAYPSAAKADHVEGGATLSCRVKNDGGLDACQVVRETPLGAGFGQAALALAPTFRMKAVDKTGAKTAGANVRIPFLFKLPA